MVFTLRLAWHLIKHCKGGNVLLYISTWVEIGERLIIGSEQIQKTIDKVRIIQAGIKATHDRQKSYADKRKGHKEYEVGEC